jgi:hypothetical protein
MTGSDWGSNTPGQTGGGLSGLLYQGGGLGDYCTRVAESKTSVPGRRTLRLVYQGTPAAAWVD